MWACTRADVFGHVSAFASSFACRQQELHAQALVQGVVKGIVDEMSINCESAGACDIDANDKRR